MIDYIIVGLGGFIGAVIRFTVYKLSAFNLADKIALADSNSFALAFSIPTLWINLLACLLLGILASANISQKSLLFFAMGLLGAFSTFSTFGLESFKLLESGYILASIIYISASVVLGIIGILLGLYLARVLAI